MIQKIIQTFGVSQLDNSWACSSLLFKHMGPKVLTSVSSFVDMDDPDVFFQMFDNLFKTKNEDGKTIRDSYGNPTDIFGQLLNQISYRPFHYGLFIFYCAHAQIDTTGVFLESLGCTVQKSFAMKTNNPVALYSIESWKFLDQYEEWMEHAKADGHEVFGSKRTKEQIWRK